jgi:Spy/CpxP family protein refolding chaperone
MRSFKFASLIAVIILAVAASAFAQPMFKGDMKGCPKDGMKGGHQKIENMKKMKLLEYLDLNEDQADKFLVKYSAGSKVIMDNMKKADDLSDKLKDAMKDNSGSKEAVALADELMKAQKSIDDAKAQLMDNMKALLPAEKFTKFVYFEANFQKEVMKRMMQKQQKRGEGEGRGGRGDSDFGPSGQDCPGPGGHGGSD